MTLCIGSNFNFSGLLTWILFIRILLSIFSIPKARSAPAALGDLTTIRLWRYRSPVLVPQSIYSFGICHWQSSNYAQFLLGKMLSQHSSCSQVGVINWKEIVGSNLIWILLNNILMSTMKNLSQSNLFKVIFADFPVSSLSSYSNSFIKAEDCIY